jgi:hypothetical protein
MKYRSLVLGLLLVGVFIPIGLSCRTSHSKVDLAHAALQDRVPRINPDYRDVVIPPNIAPLNFLIEESAVRYAVKVHASNGNPIETVSRSPKVVLPAAAWQALLQTNRGQALYFEVATLRTNDQWQRFLTITNTVAREAIDGYLVYRLLNPQYSMYASGTMGIYQRNLQTFKESTVLRVRGRWGGAGTCLNCHSFANNRAEAMALHIRNEVRGRPMLLARNGEVTRVAKTAGYLSWHPSGKMLAFSVNKLSLFVHTSGENRDVLDAASDLGIYQLDANTVTMPAPIARPERLETWPAWAPDGRTLYFCSAPKLSADRFRDIRYDLARIRYDPERNVWGEVETVLSATTTGLSAVQPKLSPDGRFLLFCLCAYGHFPVYQPNSDLYLMDLGTRQYKRLDGVNSDRADSYHSWSSNSRWFVFSSKRRDGLLARPHFSYVDEQGQVYNPILLPQADPTLYDSFLKTYNVPELVAGPVPVSQRAWINAAFKSPRIIKPKEDALVQRAEQQQSDDSVPTQSPYAQPARQ